MPLLGYLQGEIIKSYIWIISDGKKLMWFLANAFGHILVITFLGIIPSLALCAVWYTTFSWFCFTFSVFFFFMDGCEIAI